MKNTIASLLQTRMDKCTTEQFWAVATLTAFYSFLITHVPEITVAVPRLFLLLAIIGVTAYGIWFVWQRHKAYYRNRIALASLLRDEKDAPDWFKQPPDLRNSNSLSGVSFYIGCLVFGGFFCLTTYWNSIPTRVCPVPQPLNLEIKYNTNELKQPVFETNKFAVKIQDSTNTPYSTTNTMNDYTIWIIAAFGLVTLIGVFYRMTPGFGPFNLRIVGIVLISTFAALLATKDGSSLTAAMGILGAIAGYLFGIKDKNEG